MPKVAIQTTAPNFTLPNFQGQPVSLSDFNGKAHVLLVFNRGFA
jgi:peroxiredoxin